MIQDKENSKNGLRRPLCVPLVKNKFIQDQKFSKNSRRVPFLKDIHCVFKIQKLQKLIQIQKLHSGSAIFEKIVPQEKYI